MSCAMRSHRIPAGANPPDNCLSSRYAKFGVVWSWAGKPLPHNTLGEVYSLSLLLGSGPWHCRAEGVASSATVQALQA